MKAAPLTLLLVWAVPARADVAVPGSAVKKTWRDSCAARLDEAARRVGLEPAARASIIPLRREDGTANPVEYVEYAARNVTVTVGDDAEPRPDQAWTVREVSLADAVAFRRHHHRFGKIAGNRFYSEFKVAVNACLEMGESK